MTDDPGDHSIDLPPVDHSPEWWVSEASTLLCSRIPHPAYRTFTIPKGDGSNRTIKAPVDDLKDMQRRLARVLTFVIGGMPACAHAYVRRRSILSMAAPHIGKKTVLKMDVSKFFESLTVEKIVAAMRSARIHPLVVDTVRHLCFNDGRLPTGAPTSPILSNLYAREFLDHRIEKLCRTWRTWTSSSRRFDLIQFTRYADDIVLSSNYTGLSSIIPALTARIQAAGLQVNGKKTKILPNSRSQVVCGIVVNERAGAPRRRRHKLRGLLHSILCDGLAGNVPLGARKIARDAMFCEPIAIDQLAGEVAFVEFVNKRQGRRLRLLLAAVRNVHFGTPVHRKITSWIERKKTQLCST